MALGRGVRAVRNFGLLVESGRFQVDQKHDRLEIGGSLRVPALQVDQVSNKALAGLSNRREEWTDGLLSLSPLISGLLQLCCLWLIMITSSRGVEWILFRLIVVGDLGQYFSELAEVGVDPPETFLWVGAMVLQLAHLLG